MTLQFEKFEHDQIGHDDRMHFVRLVVAGGAVEGDRVREGIGRAGAQLFIARYGGEIVGVAALKVPLEDYRTTLKEKSGHELSQSAFPRELGYVAVHTEHGGRGLARSLCDFAMRYAGDQGVFATTGTPQMLTSILPKLGFRWVGKVWLGDPNTKTGQKPDLHLMVRPKTLSTPETVG